MLANKVVIGIDIFDWLTRHLSAIFAFVVALLTTAPIINHIYILQAFCQSICCIFFLPILY